MKIPYGKFRVVNNLQTCISGNHIKVLTTSRLCQQHCPQVSTEFLNFRQECGPVDKLDTRIFLTGPKFGDEFDVTIEKGKILTVKTLAMAEDITENGGKEVFFEMNGELRSVFIRDKKATKDVTYHPKAKKDSKDEVGAPMPGTVRNLKNYAILYFEDCQHTDL